MGKSVLKLALWAAVGILSQIMAGKAGQKMAEAIDKMFDK